jgi:cell division protein FtsL
MSASIKAIVLLIIILVVFAGFRYLSNLQADLAVSRENVKKLDQAIDTQKGAIDGLVKDQKKINDINTELRIQNKLQNKDMDDLRDRFNKSASGEKRDLGKSALEKPLSIERAINRGTVNAFRCLEIASGSPLTEEEKNATKISEINKECPSLANPNYKPLAGT